MPNIQKTPSRCAARSCIRSCSRFLCWFFTAVGISTYFAVRNESRVLREGLIYTSRQLARHLAASTESAFGSLNWVFVEKILQDPAQFRRGDIINIKVVKPDGEVYLANLGLSLTRSLANLHSGIIWAESEGEGHGSRFNFIIPARQ